MKYKAEDRVKTKSLEWYNENKDKFGKVWTSGGQIPFEKHMSKWCGKVMTISDVRADHYTMIEDLVGYWTDEMIEGLVEEENNHITETVVDTVRESNDRYRIVLDPRFDIEVDEGEYYAVRRKKEYPKTYEECCEIIGGLADYVWGGYKQDLFQTFHMLYICRDAYWQIAGEELELGKPWEPDWRNDDHESYPAIVACGGKIIKSSIYTHDNPFAFPTEEMRDAFFENFKELIEICKELL